MDRFHTFKSAAMRKVLATLVAGGLALGVAQQAPATPETAQQPGMQHQQDVTLPPGVDPDQPVAQLGPDEPLTQQQFAQEFDRAMRGLAMQHGLQFTDETRTMFDRFRGEFLEMYTTQQALLREAEARGIEITDAELDAQIGQARMQWGDQFDQTLMDLGFADEMAYRDSVREGMLAQRVVDQLRGDIQFDDAELQEFHQQFRTQYFGDREFDEARADVEQRFVSDRLQQRFTDLRTEHGIEVFTDRLATDTGPAVGPN
jgi:hypothetical protein